jgi:hypothetical protein
MADDTENSEDAGGNGNMADFLDLLANAIIAARDLVLNAKIKPAELKKLAKLDRQAADAVAVCDAARAEAAEIVAKIERDTNALAERERAFDALKAAFESQAQDVRDELRAHHNRIEQAHRQLIHRVMATAGILGDWNFELQDPPTWSQLQKRIAGLPDDLPVAPPAEVVSRETREDWVGHTFVPGSSLTRTVRGAA